MLQFILPVLIFLSLGVIIFILARHYPDLKEANKGNELEINRKDEARRKKILGFFSNILSIVKNFFVLIAEKAVKKSKELLHLFHYWLIRIRKKNEHNGNGDKDDFLGEIEAKEELIKEEEKNLERIIHDDLGSSEQDDFIEESRKKLERASLEKATVISTALVDEKVSCDPDLATDKQLDAQEVEIEKKESDTQKKEESKLARFFRKKDAIPETSVLPEEEVQLKDEAPEEVLPEDKESGLKKIFKAPKKILIGFFHKEKQADAVGENENQQEDDYREEDFSDGIVKIEEYEKAPVKEGLLMKEVVSVAKDRDLDEELGVDRGILEKKLINKIVQNPKQVENYRQLGELYIKMKNYSEAVECYQQIIRFKTRDADAKRKLEKIRFLKRLEG